MPELKSLVKSWLKGPLNRMGYQIFRSSSLPQASVYSFCAGLAGRGFRPKLIMDVGANRGDWSREALEVFPDAMFVLVEPQSEMAPHLQRFCSETPKSRWLQVGAADFEGELQLAVAPDTVSSSFRVSQEEAERYHWKPRTVPVRTLDSICRELGSMPDIVKLDVEGYEDKVLAGAKTLVGEVEIFLLELTLFGVKSAAMRFDEYVSLMNELGYQFYDVSGFQRRPYDGALAICEIAFARADGTLRSFEGWDIYS